MAATRAAAALSIVQRKRFLLPNTQNRSLFWLARRQRPLSVAYDSESRATPLQITVSHRSSVVGGQGGAGDSGAPRAGPTSGSQGVRCLSGSLRIAWGAIRPMSSHAAPKPALRAGSHGAAMTVTVRARSALTAHDAGLEGSRQDRIDAKKRMPPSANAICQKCHVRRMPPTRGGATGWRYNNPKATPAPALSHPHWRP